MGNVAARGVDFFVGVWNVVSYFSTWSKGARKLHTFSDVNRVTRETSSLPDQTALLGEEWRDVTADELV